MISTCLRFPLSRLLCYLLYYRPALPHLALNATLNREIVLEKQQGNVYEMIRYERPNTNMTQLMYKAFKGIYPRYICLGQPLGFWASALPTELPRQPQMHSTYMYTEGKKRTHRCTPTLTLIFLACLVVESASTHTMALNVVVKAISIVWVTAQHVRAPTGWLGWVDCSPSCVLLPAGASKIHLHRVDNEVPYYPNEVSDTAGVVQVRKDINSSHKDGLVF